MGFCALGSDRIGEVGVGVGGWGGLSRWGDNDASLEVCVCWCWCVELGVTLRFVFMLVYGLYFCCWKGRLGAFVGLGVGSRGIEDSWQIYILLFFVC